MNYLAHLYLSAETPEALLGGLLGDFVKGTLTPGRYPGAVLDAIALHRRLDSFVDAHPAFRRSRARLVPPYRRYAGILVDVFYDHYLARDWAEHADESLAGFSRRAYRAFDAHAPLLSERARRTVRAMARDDWLGAYRSTDGVERALGGLSRRLSRPNPLASGAVELRRNYAGLEADFRELLPDAAAFVAGGGH